MSELIYKFEIIALQQSNAELINEISDLKDDLEVLSGEIERLRGENPDDLQHLSEKVSEYEQREAEFKARILSIIKTAESHNKKDEVVRQLLSALQVEDTNIVETSIEQYYKKKEAPKKIIAFLLGALVALITLLISGYVENDKSYGMIIKWVRDNIL